MNKNVLFILVAAAALSACTGRDIPAPEGYELVWHDEFSGTSVSEERWNVHLGGGGFGNRELQFYHPDQVTVADGVLTITAERDFFMSHPYVSGMITTEDRAAWQYGRIEVRAQLPRGRGLWPAVWMLPQPPSPYGTWPISGEIDIMELVGHEPDVVHGTLHYGDPHTFTGSAYTLPEGDFSEDFHTFAVEWDETEFRWYVDDELFQTQTHWFSADVTSDTAHPFPAPFDHPFYLRLNVAVGGNWPGPPDEETTFPQVMRVDYVRVFQRIR
jgi:beta-glucanase (GH16 family)